MATRIRSVNAIMNQFKPVWGLTNPHLQTLLPFAIRRPPKLQLNHHELALPDGDFLELAWSSTPTGPICLLFHGLQGSLQSHYIAHLIHALVHHNVTVCFVYFRGCGQRPNNRARSYHSGDTQDMRFLIDTVRTRYPSSPLHAVGFSIGGNALLKYLGEQAADCPLSSAAAVSVPFDLAASADRLNQGFSKIYQRYLLASMRRYLRRKLQLLAQAGIDLKRALKAQSFWEFDECVTAPLHGFDSAADYYARASCLSYLMNIACPTLIIHALDDPFVHPHTVPSPMQLSTAIDFELHHHGGHVGFLAQPFRYYLDTRLATYFSHSMQYS